MSDEDPMAGVGRTAVGRAEAKKRRAFLVNTMEAISTELIELANSLRLDTPEAWKRSAELLTRLITTDKGLDYVKNVVIERMDLSVKLDELEKRAQDAGIA